MITEKKLFTVKEASKILSVAEITLYRHTKNGDVPSIRIGKRVLIPITYIEMLTGEINAKK